MFNQSKRTHFNRRSHSVRAKKSLGQHFLKDKVIIEKICNSFSKEADSIVEVGPGQGALTKFLDKKEQPLFLVEKDKRFEKNLSELVGSEHLHMGDALKLNWADHLNNILPEAKGIWFVSNLPYNVSVPLFISFCKAHRIKYLTLMFQKEVGNKLAPPLNLKNSNNSLKCIADNFFKVRELCQVGPQNFNPRPKVQSVVLTFVRRDRPRIPLEEFDLYQALLRKLFQFKRKQIATILRPYFPDEELRELLSSHHVSFDARAESLNSDTVSKIFLKLRDTHFDLLTAWSESNIKEHFDGN